MKDDDIVKEARERYEYAKTWEEDARRNFVEDMRFANGDSVNMWQWSTGDREARSTRPCLTVNKTRTHNLQIVNDARQNKAAIRISPVGDGATYDSAKIFEGVVRHIEYISQATQAYDTATYNQVYGGIGYWRVKTDYAHDNTTNMEIFIQRIANPLSVYLDPDIQQYDGSDAKWGQVYTDWTRDAFKEEYPKHAEDDTAHSVERNPLGNTDGNQDDEHIRLVEYWRMGTKTDTLHMMPDGSHVRESDVADDMVDEMKSFSRKSRAIEEPKVEWFLIAGDKIIDREEWPGRYIPIVRVCCEETVVDNKLDRVSHTRHLRDAQKAYNYYTSAAAEFVGLQTKAPWLVTADSIENTKNDWETANTKNHAFLAWRQYDEEGRENAKPERMQPPAMANAYMEGMKIAQAELMMVSGQYQAIMGEESNEISGKAITARQRQGDNATYHVIDHLASALRFTGRIIIDLIPKIYDTERVISIMAENGDQSNVHIAPDAGQAHQTIAAPQQPGMAISPQGQPDPQQAKIDAVKTLWNPSVGRYDVIAEVGPAYATRREEAFNAYSQLLASNKELVSIVGDLMMKAADFPGADEMAERLRNMVPPQALGGPSPQMQEMQQNMQAMQGQFHEAMAGAQQQVIELKQQLRDKAVIEANKADRNQIEDYKAETARLAAVGTVDPASLQIIVRQMVEQMLGTPLTPMLKNHADIEQSLQPPEPPQQQSEAA